MKITCSKCGDFLEANRLGIKGYCKKCENEYQRNYNPTIPYRKRKKSRSKAYDAVRRGILIRKPCEKCGSENSEKHHEDYDMPLDVQWLCRPCHLDLHQQNKVKDLEMEAQEIK